MSYLYHMFAASAVSRFLRRIFKVRSRETTAEFEHNLNNEPIIQRALMKFSGHFFLRIRRSIEKILKLFLKQLSFLLL